MGPNATDRPLFVEDIITALTGGMSGVHAQTLRNSMERAAVEFDERTAEAFARSLFNELSANPQDLRGLEALIILGLAHPRVIARHGISLETEGRRLAVVLERTGQGERARQLLEMLAANMPAQFPEETRKRLDQTAASNAATIDRLLQRAQECIARGYKREAIQNLQEILLLDHARQDVARMIRDLRNESENRGRYLKRILATLLVVGGVGGLGWALVARDAHVRARWDELPAARAGDAVSLQGRLDSIESLLAEEHVWTGVLQAWQERDQLRLQVQELQDSAARSARTTALEKRERQQQAEDVRDRAMLSAQRGEFDAALRDLRSALELGGEHWDLRARVLSDIAAIEKWRSRK